MVVSTIGRITQLKDLETFIRAIAMIKNTTPDVIGLIVGGVREDKQNYFESLRALVQELGIEEHIVFTGSQSYVAEIYVLSDVVVSSSKKPESFGRSVAEAIAMNTPVVATGHGGVLDIVQDGINGYFYDVGDYQVLNDKILQTKILQFDGYEYISKNFSLEYMIDETVEVYKSMNR